MSDSDDQHVNHDGPHHNDGTQNNAPNPGETHLSVADESPASSASLRGSESRYLTDKLFRMLCVMTAVVSVMVLVFLIASIISQGSDSLSWTLLTSSPEPVPEEAGIRPAIFGTIWVCTLCSLMSLPLGIGTAILLEEFKPRSKVAAWLYSIVQLNISNLAGVPSVVYGILGLTAFVSMFNLFDQPKQPGGSSYELGVTYFDQFFSEGAIALLIPVDDVDAPISTPTKGMTAYTFPFDDQGNVEIDYDNLVPTKVNVIGFDDPYPEDDETMAVTLFDDSEAGRISQKSWYYFRLPFGRGVLAGALTLMLVVLPVIIISSQEALRAVPASLRAGAHGLGATPWQVVWNVTLPAAIPGIMTGSILAMSRAIGETAPILIIAGIVYIRNAPQHIMDDFTVMPLQIYNWISRPQEEFHSIAAAAIIVLLAVLLLFNGLAVLIRHKLQRPLS
tara:strand:- start:158019 stop:159359 length:1341 start_codon:yes stop_codon:yes gene_type:complete